MDFRTHTLPLGPLETNCHLLIFGRACWLVDVGMWPKPLVEYLRREGLQPRKLLLTHGHGDHIGGVEYVLNHYPDVELLCPAGDAEMLPSPEKNLSATFLMGVRAPEPTALLNPGDELAMDEWTWSVLDTSGHTPGGVSYYCPPAGVVVTGDALFRGSIGRTDIPDGDGERLIDNIRENLLTLPGQTRVLPGHGSETTIAAETQGNPFLAG